MGRKIRALPEIALLVMLLWFSRLLLWVPFRFVAAFLEHKEGASVDLEKQRMHALRLRGRLHRLERYMPFKCTCLTKAMTAKWMLRLRGVPNTLVLGVLWEDKTHTLKAHAWLIALDTIVTGGQGHEPFRKIHEFIDA